MELTKPKTKTPEKPPEPDPLDPALVLTVQDLTELSGITRKLVIDKETLFAAVAALSAVTVEGIEIPLEYRLLTRLKSRCLDKENFPRWLRETIIRQLHDFAGW